MHCGYNGRFGIQIEGGFKTNWKNKRTKKEIKEKKKKADSRQTKEDNF